MNEEMDYRTTQATDREAKKLAHKMVERHSDDTVALIVICAKRMECGRIRFDATCHGSTIDVLHALMSLMQQIDGGNEMILATSRLILERREAEDNEEE